MRRLDHIALVNDCREERGFWHTSDDPCATLLKRDTIAPSAEDGITPRDLKVLMNTSSKRSFGEPTSFVTP